MEKHEKIYGVAVIGGGIIGAAVAHRLARYQVDVLLLEKNPVFADETSKGNSGVIHGGFDPDPAKSEARLNIEGAKMWLGEIFPDLGFARANVPSIVIAFDENEMRHVRMLYERGLRNGVSPDALKVLSRDEILKREPNVNPAIVGGLLCTSSWAIDPVQATHAFLAIARMNGADMYKQAEVVGISHDGEKFEIALKGGQRHFAKTVVNAAGHYADKIAELAGYPDYKQTTRRGEYIVLDRKAAGTVNSIIFMVPTIHGKGVIVAPMLNGCTLVGPTAEEGVPKEDTRLVTAGMREKIAAIGRRIVPTLDVSRACMTFSGSRPIEPESNDFVIAPAKKEPRFVNAGGMQSPAIASAPAIAADVCSLLAKAGLKLIPRDGYKAKYSVFF